MRDPTTSLFAEWTSIIASGQMIGHNRPIGRVTVSREWVRRRRTNKDGPWRSILFSQKGGATIQKEIPGVVQIDINRSIGQDAATCTVTVANALPSTTESQDPYEHNWTRPGWVTPMRSEVPTSPLPSAFETHVGSDVVAPKGNYQFSETELHDYIVTNNLLWTYQGYGSDNMDEDGQMRPFDDPEAVQVEDDTKLALTGVWLIDSVDINAVGQMVINCRDLAKLLITQFVYPDILPLSRFPLVYCPIIEDEKVVGATDDSTVVTTGKNVVRGLGAPSGYYETSNDPWYGRDASIYGHVPNDAFDGTVSTYWLSVGNGSGTAGYAFEYITAKCNGDAVNTIEVATKKKNYTMYVGIYEDGEWKGSNTVPYNPDAPPAFPNGSDEKYVYKTTVGSEGRIEYKLPATYNPDYIRITFHNLQDFNLGTFQYRVGVAEFSAYHKKKTTIEGDPGTVVHESNEGEPGVIVDWSSAVIELLGWAGFTWVHGESPSTEPWPAPTKAHPLIGTTSDTQSSGDKASIWGDIMELGAGPIFCTDPAQFISKSFMEGINTIKDWLGCIFFVDEYGGAIFRLPNVFSAGNYIHEPGSTRTRVKAHPIEFHENVNLISYTASLNDASLRSRVIVVGESPDVHGDTTISAAVDLDQATSIISIRNLLGGQDRTFFVPGEQTKGFHTFEECARMAELISVQILFTFRKGKITAPCHPGLQLDDQVRVFERTTNEFYVHYVTGISTSMNVQSGVWTMDLETNWLGEDPSRNWFADFDAFNFAPKLKVIEEQLASNK